MDLPGLLPLRQAIDKIDHEILELLRRRVQHVLEVGELKRRHGSKVYDPERERRMLDRLAGAANEPLEGATVRRVFERIIDESRRQEKHHIDER